MQILSSANSMRMTSVQSPTAADKPEEILRKSDLTGDPVADLARGFSPNLLLTDSDRALIEDVTGVKVDPDTGVCTPPTSNADFINNLVDKRFMEYVNLKPSQPMTETDIRDIFKQATAAGNPLDPNLMQKAIDWMSDVTDSKSRNAERPKQVVDVYA